ncbi:hypothetical protein KC325_g78 [Hortaea werneckii]|nr:hypothetical protein KC325_g78 [Hortaea werneckii]
MQLSHIPDTCLLSGSCLSALSAKYQRNDTLSRLPTKREIARGDDQKPSLGLNQRLHFLPVNLARCLCLALLRSHLFLLRRYAPCELDTWFAVVDADRRAWPVTVFIFVLP